MAPDDRVRVVVAEDHPLMLEAIVSRLERDPTIEVVATAHDGPELVDQYREHHPDVVLSDYGLPGMTGIEATRVIIDLDSGAKILILSAFDDQSLVAEGIRAGALGYLLKSITGSELITTVHAAAEGRYRLDDRTTDMLVRELRGPTAAEIQKPSLSAREREVLGLVAEGLSNPEIAAQLFISLQTVKTHVERIFTKLGVSDRAAAVRMAMEQDLLG